MPYCTNCGKSYTQEGNYCVNCGADLISNKTIKTEAEKHNSYRNNNDNLEIRIKELDHQYALAKRALAWGWIPFVLIPTILVGGIVSIAVSEAFISSISGIFDSTLVTIFSSPSPKSFKNMDVIIITISIVTIIGLAVFYSYAFKRAIKIKAALSQAKIKLDIET